MQHLHQISWLKIKGMLTTKAAEVESGIKDASFRTTKPTKPLTNQNTKTFYGLHKIRFKTEH